MKYTIAAASAFLGFAVAQSTTTAAAAAAGCTSTFSGQFEISIVKATQKRAVAPVEKRGACSTNGVLVMTLQDGVAKDAQGRTGYIASNYQFQFDDPPQAGSLVSSGFEVCSGNLLSLQGSTTFYQCLSGTFYNLYNTDWADQCEAVQIVAIPCGGSSTGVATGQVVGTANVVTTIVTALSDGQPQVVTTAVPIPMCQIGDGQVQVHTVPCGSQPTSLPVVSQISDGQIQVTTPAVKPSTNPGSMTKVTNATTPAVIPTPSASQVVGNGSARVSGGSAVAFVVGLAVALVGFSVAI